MNPYLKGANTLRAFDHAGNYSDFNFKIPELSAININSENALYSNFKGVSATAPSTLERSHSFEFSESVAGVSAVSIDGPQGNLWSRTFDPPVFSTSTSLSDLPTGDYVVKSFNAVGEETKTPFTGNFIFSYVGNGFSHTIAFARAYTKSPHLQQAPPEHHYCRLGNIPGGYLNLFT